MRKYLGDGAYVEFDDFGCIWLVTNDGIRDTNRVCLEPVVWATLMEYVDERRKHVADSVTPANKDAGEPNSEEA